MEAKALWHIAPGKVSWRTHKLSELQSDQVLLKSHYSFVSQGTEKLINQSAVPKSLHDNMRVPYMQGDFNLPCTYGYSLVGEVVNGPEDLLGRMAHVMHPHQDYCVVNSKDLFFVDKSHMPELASLISNGETAINAMWDGEASKNDRILIIGLGSIGLLTALTLKTQLACEIMVYDLDHDRLKIANKLGLKTWNGTGEFDLIYHTTASNEGLQKAIDVGGHEARICELSWYGDKSVDIKIGASFHYKRQRIIGSQVSHIPKKITQHDFNSRKKLVWETIQQFPHLDFNTIEYTDLIDDYDLLKTSHIFNLIKY